MKKLYIICGTMGVGKTAVSLYLKEKLPNAVLLDGDWCWSADPFQVNEETKTMVIDNICHVLNNFIACSAYENIIFCWVLHKKEIIDNILEKLNIINCDVKVISLLASVCTLKDRIMKDVNSSKRSIDVLERSIARLSLYQELPSIKINTDNKDVYQIVDEIVKL